MSETARTASEQPADAEADTSVTEEGTVRDRVWDATLVLIAKRPLPFQTWRIRKRAGLDRGQDRTIRRVLSAMEAAGWVEHEENAKWWYPGERAKDTFETYGREPR